MATVRAGARLHAGFTNLSLAHERLYGGVGVALAEPEVVVEAEPAASVEAVDASDVGGDDASDGGADDAGNVGAVDYSGTSAEDPVARYAGWATEHLDVPGAAVTVRERLPRHVGLGSGTQLALAIYAAIAAAHDEPVDVRAAAPALGRGGRSGVGVAGFECGGFLVDGGHPTARFTTARPERGEWTVPPVVARHELPADWRFVLAIPAGRRGRSGDAEDASLRSVVEAADPAVADEVAAVLVRRLLPAAARADRAAFGDALAEIERHNGTWYADVQGGVFRPPAGELVDVLGRSDAVDGAGQSSWGPTVYGLTDADRADSARAAAERALEDADVEGQVRIARVATEGASVER